MNKKRSALIVLLILLIAAAAYGVWHYQQQQDKPLTLYGNVDIRTVNLGFRVDGRLASLTVDEGDAVQPGQLLGKLDDAPYRNALQQAEANVGSARAKLSLLQAGYRAEEIAQVRSEMAQRQSAFAYADSFLKRQQGLWAKDGHNFVYIERVKGNDELGGVSIYAFNPERRLQSVRYAASAKFDSENKVWRLSQVDESDLTDPKQVTGSQMVSGTWKTNLTPDKLGVVALDPDALSISGLHNYVKYLKSSGQDPGRYQLNMWSKIFQPLSVAVMMLMALSFIFGPLRSVPMGVRVVTGISFGFIFYVLDQIFGPLTLVYGIPPIIGALLPSASFFLISLWLMMRKA